MLVVLIEQTAFVGSVAEAFLHSLQKYQHQEADTVEILREQIVVVDAKRPQAETELAWTEEDFEGGRQNQPWVDE